MLEDWFKFYKGCQACQRFGRVQVVPASTMNPIIKPWPFRGWGMDMIGKINPPSSKGHQFILAITDYFTKWVEAVLMKSATSRDVINFVKEHVIHRFGIPQTITTDGGSVFISIKLIRSSPYYAQANGQAEASNHSLIKLIKRKYYQKHYGLIVCHAMGQQEPHHIIWCMGRRPYCHGKLQPVRDG
jgi:hypothetical protein